MPFLNTTRLASVLGTTYQCDTVNRRLSRTKKSRETRLYHWSQFLLMPLSCRNPFRWHQNMLRLRLRFLLLRGWRGKDQVFWLPRAITTLPVRTVSMTLN